MGVLSSMYPTMLDVARRTDPNGKIATIVELMNEQNPILEDMVVQECNNGMVHRTTVRTGLPQGTWRRLYQGVQPDKSTTRQVTDTCGMLEAYSQVDKALADMAPDKAAFLLTESTAFLEGLNQQMATALFYGDTAVDPEKFTGLAARYAKYGTDPEKSSYNVINGGGTGSDNTSIWLLYWGTQTISGLYPKGSKAGLSHQDLGEVTHVEPDGSMYQVYRGHYKWDLGFTVRDWRYGVRIANIDVSNLDGTNSADLLTLLIRATHRVPAAKLGRPVIYCNKTIATALDLQAMRRNNLMLTYAEVDGHPQTSFRGIPIKTCDAILDTEAAVEKDS
ncbi:MAG: major capsid protein [Pyramidobacter sp.]|jgi:hypothetical protein